MGGGILVLLSIISGIYLNLHTPPNLLLYRRSLNPSRGNLFLLLRARQRGHSHTKHRAYAGWPSQRVADVDPRHIRRFRTRSFQKLQTP